MNELSFEQRLAAELNKTELDKLLTQQPYEYKSIFLNRIKPDNSNPRFFPAMIISDQLAFQAATKRISKHQLVKRLEAKNKVLIGKSCIVNCFENGTNDWKKANITIASLMELAANVAVAELIQVPTIFPLEDGSYQILTGHRRFFAMIYANGINSAAHFKVYDHKPSLPKTKQFQENASREDLPQYGKLQAFQDAMLELEILNGIRMRADGKGMTVREHANLLGISMGAFDNYNVLTRYPAVIEYYKNGNSMPFLSVKKIILNQETRFKSKINQTVLNVEHKRTINNLIKNILNNTEVTKKSLPTNPYRLGSVDSPELMKLILTENILALDTGVEWNKVDWSQPKAVNDAFEQVIVFLKKSLPQNNAPETVASDSY